MVKKLVRPSKTSIKLGHSFPDTRCCRQKVCGSAMTSWKTLASFQSSSDMIQKLVRLSKTSIKFDHFFFFFFFFLGGMAVTRRRPCQAMPLIEDKHGAII